jgi:hypothetical protein
MVISQRPRWSSLAGLGSDEAARAVSLVIGLNEGRSVGSLQRAKQRAMLHRGYPARDTAARHR